MKRINVDIDDMRAFRALVETGSFRTAAEDIGVSPSALSRQITRLESRVGSRLFDRDTRNVALTPQGQVFLRLAERILNTTENALVEFKAYQAARRGRLTIAGLPSVTAGLLPKLVQQFLDAHPDVDVQINDVLSNGIIREVELGEADLGFTAGAVEVSERLSFQKLLTDRFVAVGAPGGPLDERRTYGWHELVCLPFVAMAKGTSVRTLTDAACAQQGLLFRPRFEVSHLATAGAFVSQGLGVTALPALTLPVLGREPLIFRPLGQPELLRDIGLIWRSGRTLSPAAVAFLELVRKTNLAAQIPDPFAN
jgi:LysR family carnitine catabolism transcriptional activator|tara:strand:- start:27032 stop:27961 length:930 start_codon:yes stop_codon:yes gene_type:complete